MIWFWRKKEELGLLGPDPVDIRDFQLAEIQPKVVALPDVFSLRDKMTSIQKQNWGTCTSHMADAIAEYWNSLEYHKEIKLAQKFIYYNTKKISGLWTIQGDYLRNAFKSVVKYGACLEETFPDIRRKTWEEYIKDVPPPEAYQEAEKFKGKTFWAVTKGLDSFRQAIYQNKTPIGFGMRWYESYRDIGQDGKLPLPGGKELGGHAVVGVDWEYEKFWVRNSWGKKWGNKGYFYIPFNEFDKHEIWNAYVLLDIQRPKIEGWVAGKYLRETGLRFHSGDKVKSVFSKWRLRIRENPGLNTKQIDWLKPGEIAEILEGGIRKDGYVWWKIRKTALTSPFEIEKINKGR